MKIDLPAQVCKCLHSLLNGYKRICRCLAWGTKSMITPWWYAGWNEPALPMHVRRHLFPWHSSYNDQPQADVLCWTRNFSHAAAKYFCKPSSKAGLGWSPGMKSQAPTAFFKCKVFYLEIKPCIWDILLTTAQPTDWKSRESPTIPDCNSVLQFL